MTDIPEGYVAVVTRYGTYRHLSRAGGTHAADMNRHFTTCRGTSSWTLESWRSHPDHPSLTPDQMLELPLCPMCIQIVNRLLVPNHPATATALSMLRAAHVVADELDKWDPHPSPVLGGVSPGGVVRYTMHEAYGVTIYTCPVCNPAK